MVQLLRMRLMRRVIMSITKRKWKLKKKNNLLILEGHHLRLNSSQLQVVGLYTLISQKSEHYNF